MNEADYLNAITKSIDEKRALVLKDGNILVGAMAFSDYSGCIDFLGIKCKPLGTEKNGSPQGTS